MKRTTVMMALALLTLSVPLRTDAQVLIDQTDPSAETTTAFTVFDVQWLAQTFVAKSASLTSLTVWFHGGRWGNPRQSDAYARFDIWPGLAAPEEGGQLPLFRTFLDQSHNGELTFLFSSPLVMTEGATYTFALFSSICGDIGDCGDRGMVPGPTTVFPSLEVTTRDAYADGNMWHDRRWIQYPERDIRFVAVYGVDEPHTLALLAAIVPLVFARRRRLKFAGSLRGDRDPRP